MNEQKLSTKQVTVEDLKNIMGGQEEIAASIKGSVSYKNGGLEASVEAES